MPEPVTLAAGAMIVVGLVGIALPLLPGLLLIWGGVLLWSTEAQSTAGWVALGVATALVLIGLLIKYLVPGRRMRAAGGRKSTTLAGVMLGVIGFFVLPVVGLPLGFVLGVYLAERSRRGTHDQAWAATVHALKAIGLSIGIELLTGLAIATTWGVTVFATN